MIRNSILVILYAIFLLSISCKDKEAEKLKKEQQKEKNQKTKSIELNKDFMYSCNIITSKTGIPLENVQLVLKKYFEDKKNFVFELNSFVVINNENWEHPRKHNLDLIEETSKKYAIPYNDIVKIYTALELSEHIEDLEDQMYYLEGDIQDLESEIRKNN